MERLDVVIPVYRPDRRFFKLMRMVFSQDELPGKVQIMLTLSGQESEAEQLLKRIEKIRDSLKASQVTVSVTGVLKENFDHGATRNLGIAACNAPYVLCLTGDAVPADTALFRTLLQAMERDNETIAVYARQVAPRNAGAVLRLTQNYNYPAKSRRQTESSKEELGIKTIFCSDVCCLYHRNRFFCLDGFEQPVLFGEDMLFAAKAIEAGYAVRYEAGAVVEHGHAFSLRDTFRRNFLNGVNQTLHAEVFRRFSSEQEGTRYVKHVFAELKKEQAYLSMISFAFQCAVRYAGFLAGRYYRFLPKALVRRLSGNSPVCDS